MKTSLFAVVLSVAAGAAIGAHFATPIHPAMASAHPEADVPVVVEPPAEPPMVTLAPTVIIAKRAPHVAPEHICNWDDVTSWRPLHQGTGSARLVCGGR